jgi:O-antigen/teichoic acid export membrane protein
LVASFNRRGGLGGALFINLAGGVTLQLLLLVSGVVLARALGPDDRGNMALLTVVSAIAWQLGGLGIPFALTYVAARAPGAARRSFDSLGRAIAVQAVGAAVAAAILLAVLTADRPTTVKIGAAMTALAIVAMVYQRCGYGILQGLKRFLSFNVLRVASNALFSPVAAILWLTGDKDFLPYAVAWALSNAALTPVVMWKARRAADEVADSKVEVPSRHTLLVFGRKSLFGGDPPVENYRLDQATVAFFLSASSLGYYVSALAFTNLPRFIALSFATVATPVIAGQPTHKQAVRKMWSFWWLAMPFYLSVIAVLFLLAPWLVTFFFGHEFARSGGLCRLLLISTALFCARRVLADSARGAGYPGIGSIAELTALIAVFPLFAVAVPTWGLDGVAYALIVSSIIALTILVGGVLHLTRGGKVPDSWAEIHGEPADEVAVETAAKEFRTESA